jgi:hypothetical protein
MPYGPPCRRFSWSFAWSCSLHAEAEVVTRVAESARSIRNASHCAPAARRAARRTSPNANPSARFASRVFRLSAPRACSKGPTAVHAIPARLAALIPNFSMTWSIAPPLAPGARESIRRALTRSARRSARATTWRVPPIPLPACKSAKRASKASRACARSACSTAPMAAPVQGARHVARILNFQLRRRHAPPSARANILLAKFRR